MATKKQMLTAKTPHGEFTRTTARPYTHVAVFGVPDKAYYQAEIDRMTKRPTAGSVDFTAHCRRMIQTAEENANNPRYVSEVTWHSSKALAAKAKAVYGEMVKRGVYPVNRTHITLRCVDAAGNFQSQTDTSLTWNVVMESDAAIHISNTAKGELHAEATLCKMPNGLLANSAGQYFKEVAL